VSVQRGAIWGERARGASPLDRCSFLASPGAATAATAAVPSWATGPASYPAPDKERPKALGEFAARVPGADFAVVPGAGHSIFSDRPEEALGILRPWLRGQDRG